MWPTSYKNLRQLASGEGFNEYFQTLFNGNEATYLRWKEVFDVLEIVGQVGCHHNVRVHLETKVLTITRSEDLVKLRALAKLCSEEFFDDMSLLLVVWRRFLEVLELAMPEEKKVRGKKKKQQKKKKDPKKLEMFDACVELGFCWGLRGCEAIHEASEGEYEEQLGREKALEVTVGLILVTGFSKGERIEKYRDLLPRMVRALGEENVVTLKTLNALGYVLQDNGEYEEAKEVHERCLAGEMKVLGEDHKETLATLNNLGVVYNDGLKNYEKSLEYYEGALKGYEGMLGKNHPETTSTVMNVGIVYKRVEEYGKAEELYERALEG
ncbi:hypothetical protein TL16_g07150 [Triparma laevis f. inornata]|uniref:Uncharacterized protein n=1 Tax=Triparma laevis f. inornata TaxID=1714386 RepID=A0A9W7ARY5_9STRA|nr:hypothetical protein TL16_g07150 [Triparma laevis f. inornata]